MDPALLRQVAEEFIPFNRFLGLKAKALESGRVQLELPFREEFVGDPMRPALHGGVISMMADTAGGIAVWSTLEGTSSRVSTIDLRVDYLRPGKLEPLVAEATVVRVGGRVGVADVRMFHPGNPVDTVATGKGVYAVKHPKVQKA